jgi:hypothetical protein
MNFEMYLEKDLVEAYTGFFGLRPIFNEIDRRGAEPLKTFGNNSA